MKTKQYQYVVEKTLIKNIVIEAETYEESEEILTEVIETNQIIYDLKEYPKQHFLGVVSNENPMINGVQVFTKIKKAP